MARKRLKEMSGGVFLIGLGLLWWTGLGFWPWILVLLAITAMINNIADTGLRGTFSGLFWLIGLFVLFQTGTLWPGILILIGLSIVGEALVRKSGTPGAEATRKAKRGIPVPPPDDDYYAEEDYGDEYTVEYDPEKPKRQTHT